MRAGYAQLWGRLFRPNARPERACAAFVVGLVAVACLYPFELRACAPDGIPPEGLGWPVSDATDLTGNVVLYLPVGAAFMLALTRSRSGRAAAVVAILAGAGMSVLIEHAQILIATRFPSWIDVLVNTLATSMGVFVVLLARPAARLLAAGPRPWARASTS